MIILVLDQLGCYASVIAASYLVGILETDPAVPDIIDLPFFAAHQNLQVGKLYYIGKDKLGNDYYSLGAGGESQLLETSIRDLLKILGRAPQMCIINVSQFNTLAIRIASLLKLIMFLHKPAKILAGYFLHRSFAQLAEQTKKELASITVGIFWQD